MKMLPLFFLCLFAATVSEARLGESYDECVARYGEPVAELEDEGIAKFEKQGFEISVYFNDDWVADMILFQKGEGPLYDELSETELNIFLSVNVGEDLQFERGIGETNWTNEDTGAIGHYNPFRRGLIVMTADGLKRREAMNETNEKKALSDF